MEARSAERGTRKKVVFIETTYFRVPRSAFRVIFLLCLCRSSFAEDIPLRPGVSTASSTLSIEDLDSTVQFVEQEFDPTLLDHLPMPATPPAHAALPKTVVEKGQWRGGLSGITQPAQVTFRKQESWVKFWSLAISPYSTQFKTVPVVDFSKDIVVGVFAGEFPSPSHEIEILSADVEGAGSSQVFAVRYRNRQRMQAVFSPPFPVQPFHLMKVPVFPGHVSFVDASPQ